MAYTAVLFDLFDTLVRFHRDLLPPVEVEGKIVRSTVGHLHEVLRPHAPEVTVVRLYRALIESWQDAERQRALDHREVAAPERFDGLLRRLGLEPPALPPDLVTTLLETHRRELSRVAEVPPHHRALLTTLAQDYRLAVVSNFDYTPTAVGILEDAGVSELFSAVIVSDAVGWRKPSPVIFHEALRRVGVSAGEALFVGDRADIDVTGARGVGMPVAWLNPEAAPLPAGIAPPDFEIRDLGELIRILKTEEAERS